MTISTLFIILSFIAGIFCGYGTDKMAARTQKIAFADYQAIVHKINNDATIAADAKTRLLNQLHEYAANLSLSLESLDAALQELIKNASHI